MSRTADKSYLRLAGRLHSMSDRRMVGSMALSAPQFTYFTDKLDVMEPELGDVKTAVEATGTDVAALVVDVAALEVLVTTTNTKLDTVITALDTLNASVGGIGLNDTPVLRAILAEAVGVRNFTLE